MAAEDDILSTIKQYETDDNKKTPKESIDPEKDILQTISQYDEKKTIHQQVKEQVLGKDQSPESRGTWSDVGAGFLQGLHNIPYGASQLATRALGATPEQAARIPEELMKQQLDLQQAMRESGTYPGLAQPLPLQKMNIKPKTIAGDIGETLGEAAALTPLTGGIATSAAKLLPGLAAKSPALMAGIGGALAGGASQPIIGAAKGEPNLAGSAAIGAATGGVLGASLSKMLPYLLTSKLSPLQITSQVKPVINDEINNLKNIFSGGQDPHDINKILYERSKQLFKELKGDKLSPEEYKYIQPNLSIESIYETAYDSLKLPNKFEDLNKVNKQMLKDLRHKIEIVPKGSNLQRDLINIKNEIEGYKQRMIMPKGSTPDEILSNEKSFDLSNVDNLKTAKNVISKRINELYNLNPSYARDQAIKSMQATKEALFDDIHAIAKKDSISDYALDYADEYYRTVMGNFKETVKDKFTPFYKIFTNRGKEENFLGSYIKPSKSSDSTASIENLFNILPNAESKDMVRGWIFKDAQTPKQVIERYNQFGEKQKKLLFGEKTLVNGETEVSQEKMVLDKLSKLYKKYPQAFKDEPAAEKHLKMGAQLVGGGIAALKGYPGIATAATVFPVGQMIGAPLLTKLRPSLIQNYIEGAISPKPIPGVFTRGISSMIPNLYQNIRGNQQ